MTIYKCEICGLIVEEITPGSHPSCCGDDMTEMRPGESDGAGEKHVPVYKLSENEVTVTVGEVEHPMLDAHYIEWIAVETNQGTHRKNLSPGEKPEKSFLLSKDESVTAVYAYCNLHGLWKA